MSTHSSRAALLLAGALALAPAARAQDAVPAPAAPSARALRLHQATRGTPLGALTPVAPAHALGLRGGGAGLQLRYGSTRFDHDYHDGNIALGMEVPAGASAFGITIGYKTPDCATDATCPAHVFTGGRWSRSIVTRELSPEAGRALLSLGLDTELGVGLPRSATYGAASLGVPMALVAGRRVRFGPYLVPGVAYAAHRADGAVEHGALALVGGGFTAAGLLPHLGVDLGFQKVLVDGTDTQIGVGVTWRGLR